MRKLIDYSRLVTTAMVVALLWSCSDDTSLNRPVVWPEAGSKAPDMAIIPDITETDLGSTPDGLVSDQGAPTITLLQPKPNVVVMGTTLKVQARIVDTDGVDDKTVTVSLSGATAVAMAITSTPSVYEGVLDISKTGNKLRLVIAAADTLGKKAHSVTDFQRDPGPRIKFTSPAKDSRYKESVNVVVVVSDVVEVKQQDVSVRIGATKIPMKDNNTTDKTRRYMNGTVKFDAFKPPLSGKQVLTAEATNANGAKSTATQEFYVDDQGPSITVSSQKPGDLIGGVIEIKATVTDLAGVVDSTVMCVVGNGLDTRKVILTNTTATPTVYAGQFDTRTLNQAYLWPVMSFRAVDKLGNEAHIDIQVGLDNAAPVMELDPPEDFYLAELKSSVVRCSRPLDPVGPDAVDDLMQVPQVTKIRADIEDAGNYVPSAPWVPVSLVDPTTAYLYVLDDTTKPIVVDTTGDGYCDDINPEVVPLGSMPKKGEAVAVKLEAVKPSGKADMRPYYALSAPDGGATSKDAGSTVTMMPLPPGCGGWGTESNAPDPLCLSTSATVAIPYTSGSEAAIYGIPPVKAGSKDYHCLGLPFDFLANNFSSGWVCVAVTAKDKQKNRGVSPPLRLYVNLDTSFTAPTTTLPAGAGMPPNCTGTLNKTSGKVEASKPCKFRNPREGSIPSQNIYKCKGMANRQMFCHQRVYVK